MHTVLLVTAAVSLQMAERQRALRTNWCPVSLVKTLVKVIELKRSAEDHRDRIIYVWFSGLFYQAQFFSPV